MACHTGIGSEHFTLLGDILEAARPELLRKTETDFRRDGPLSPRVLVMLLLAMAGDAGRRGYQLLLEGFWQTAELAGHPLATRRPVSASALCQARRKIDPAAIRTLLHLAGAHFEQHFGPQHRWNGHRLVAVDGSRATTRRSAKLFAVFGSSHNANNPQVSVSTLFDVVSKVPLDVAVRPYGTDERRDLIEQHLGHLREGDIVLLDRGYPSFDMLVALRKIAVDFVIRVPASSGFKAVDAFLASGQRDAQIQIDRPHACGAEAPAQITVRAVRMDRPGDDPIVVLTSLSAADVDVAQIAELYHLRWGVEEHYKLTKGEYLGHRGFHAKTPEGVEQEIYAQALFIALSRHLMAAAARHHEVPYENVSQKRGLLVVADHLTDVLLASDSAGAAELLERMCCWIVARLEPTRPGRSYPRRSYKPIPRWGPRGKRASKA